MEETKMHVSRQVFCTYNTMVLRLVADYYLLILFIIKIKTCQNALFHTVLALSLNKKQNKERRLVSNLYRVIRATYSKCYFCKCTETDSYTSYKMFLNTVKRRCK